MTCKAETNPSNMSMYLIGGLNFDACREVIEGRLIGDIVSWERVQYSSTENIQGRQCHTSVSYNNKIYTFGGCFMFNRKRQLRECTNTLLEYDVYDKRIEVIRTRGHPVSARKNHCATLFRKSMLIFGGNLENGNIETEMISLGLDNFEWIKITLK